MRVHYSYCDIQDYRTCNNLAASYPQQYSNPTCSSLSGTLPYETYVASQKESGCIESGRVYRSYKFPKMAQSFEAYLFFLIFFFFFFFFFVGSDLVCVALSKLYCQLTVNKASECLVPMDLAERSAAQKAAHGAGCHNVDT